MNWTEFTESNREYPENIVEKSIEGFSEATQDLAKLTLIKIRNNNSYKIEISKSFQFNVMLSSSYIKEYKFKPFRFGYNVDFYPVAMVIDSSIKKEIFGEGTFNYNQEFTNYNNEKEFINIVETIFSSERFKEIVSGVIKIARREKSKFEI